MPRPQDPAETAWAGCCASPAWQRAVLAGRPYADVEDLVARSGAAVLALDDAELALALAGHPRIGERGGADSRREQAGVGGADASVLARIAEGNRRYEARFGHVYLVRAAGRSAEELLALLLERLEHDPASESAVVRRELADITALRLRRLAAS